MRIVPCALQWWLTHNKDGSKRTKSRNANLLDPAGCDVATGFLLWLEQEAPGFIGGAGRRRVQDLVRCASCMLLALLLATTCDKADTNAAAKRQRTCLADLHVRMTLLRWNCSNS